MKINQNIRIVFYLLLCYCITSCKHKEATINDVENDTVKNIACINRDEKNINKYGYNEESNDLLFTVINKPIEYIALKELDDTTDCIKYHSIINELKGLQYYTLRIALGSGVGNILEYKNKDRNKRIHYLSFEMQGDVFLVEGNDTLACVLYQYEPPVGIAPYLNIDLAFKDNGDKKQNRFLIIKDKEFESGNTIIKISQANIINVPKFDCI